MNDLIIFDMPKTMSDDEIKSTMRQFIPMVESGKGTYLTINGFDDNPLPLYKIPEAVNLCKKLVSLGFISVLEVSSLLQEDRPELRDLLGAFEVWAIATGQYDKFSSIAVTKELFEVFVDVLGDSNRKLRQLTKIINEGHHRI